MEFVMCRRSLPHNRHVAEGAVGGSESFIQQAGLTIAFCGSYVNPRVLDAADGTRGGGDSLTWQAGQLIASSGSYVNPGCPDAVSDSLRSSCTCSGSYLNEGRLTGVASLSRAASPSTFEGCEHPCCQFFSQCNVFCVLR